MIRKHTKRRGRSALLVAAVLLAVLALLHLRGLLAGPESVLQRVFSPVLYGVHEAGSAISTRVIRIATLWDADARLGDAETRIAALEAERETLREVQRENAFLREQLRVLPIEPRPALLARIIGTNTVASNTYLLDRGRDDGLTVHAPALANGALVGYITTVEQRTAQLRLITDPKSVIEASIPEANVRAVLVGTLGQRDLLLRDIPRDADIAVGMSVLSEGTGDGQHTPLVVGTISEVLADASATSLEARVMPITRPRDLDIVLLYLAP